MGKKKAMKKERTEKEKRGQGKGGMEKIAAEMATTTPSMEEIFQARLSRHHDELRWLYMELYENGSMFAELCQHMHEFYQQRSQLLKANDEERVKKPLWFKERDMLGMMLYIDNFAGNLKGVQGKLDYLEACNVNCIHLMPFLDTPEGRSDGGYAVSDFRKVKPELGTMQDLSEFTDACRQRGMSVCMDFVMNHTSEDHEWAKKARSGDGEYMSRYFFYDNDEIPKQYEATVPQVFPTTAPGNFTYLPDMGYHVLTTFYPYQWDLNYKNPRVFNEMMYHFLYLANRGIDVIRIDAVPYIWKELGTPCRNLPQVHTIVRMMRIIGEIVCPGVILLGEVVMEPDKVAPYFGTVEKPECHMLYNVTTMATTWNSVATRDVRLLKRQLELVSRLPKEYTFLNYLRCHDDIGWGLDYETLEKWGMKEPSHKKYLNDYFTGKIPGSVSRGELYNDDEATQDARFCGTTASMCGIESAGCGQNGEQWSDQDGRQGSKEFYVDSLNKMEEAIRLDLMLHAYMLCQTGIPMLYSGDEIGQLNDASYKEDPLKCTDSRYLHRGKFHWEQAKKAGDSSTVEGKIFQSLSKLEKIRKKEAVFSASAKVDVYDSGDTSVLCIVRSWEGQRFFGVYNFGDQEKTLHLEEDGKYQDLFHGGFVDLRNVNLPAHGFLWAAAKES